MLRSMTGFGAATREDGELSLRVEVRSVNHRHVLVKSRLPGEFAFLEGEIEAGVKKRLARGSVTVHVGFDRGVDGRAVGIDADVAQRYRDDIVAVAKKLGVAPDVSMDTLLGLPGVVGGTNGAKADPRDMRKAVLATVDEAVGRLVEMRETEGAAIGTDLAKHAKATDRIVRQIQKRMPAVVRAHQKSLEKRVGELLQERQVVQSADIAREVALLADRLDVNEEVARLDSHLSQLDAFLAKGGRIGRKLDFLVQEIFREVNTIGSKCSDAKVAHWVVDAKTHVERLREQVQNVE